MKHNHQAWVCWNRCRPNAQGNLKKYGTGYGDATKGHRGQARQKAGLKKYIRTRRRFAENAALGKEVALVDLDD